MCRYLCHSVTKSLLVTTSMKLSEPDVVICDNIYIYIVALCIVKFQTKARVLGQHH